METRLFFVEVRLGDKEFVFSIAFESGSGPWASFHRSTTNMGAC
jgi:hypothetical protein